MGGSGGALPPQLDVGGSGGALPPPARFIVVFFFVVFRRRRRRRRETDFNGYGLSAMTLHVHEGRAYANIHIVYPS